MNSNLPHRMIETKLVTVLTVLSAVPAAFAHGWIEVPGNRQRDCGNNRQMTNWGGGDNTYIGSAGGGYHTDEPPLGGVPGVCGDPFKPKDTSLPESDFFSMPCDEPLATYEEGQIIDVTATIQANHGGMVEWRLCCEAANTFPSQDCFNANVLQRVDFPHSEFWLLTQDVETDDRGNNYYSYQLKLPDGISCPDGGMLQMTYYTAHTCILPCDDRELCGFYADRKNEIVYPGSSAVRSTCPSKFPARGEKPQIFQNCADIAIMPKAGGQSSSTPTPMQNESAPLPTEEDTSPATTMSMSTTDREETFVEENEEYDYENCDQYLYDKDFRRMGDLVTLEEISDPETCVSECNAYDGELACNAFTLHQRNNRCYLKHLTAGDWPTDVDASKQAVSWKEC